MTNSDAVFSPVSFGDILGWADDDHQAAFRAFSKSAARLLNWGSEPADATRSPPDGRLLAACTRAQDLVSDPGATAARSFFEASFTPHRVTHASPRGLLTAYYEPLLEGRRHRSGAFKIPILKRPADLINLVHETERGARSAGLTHARQSGDGHVPYATREEIERGALAGLDLEFAYFRDPVDVFFLHIQGSGLVEFEDGTRVRVTYDGKNGHPYTSVGRFLIDQGLMSADDMSLWALHDWLRSDRERGRQVMWQNKSYIFFRELDGSAQAPIGACEIPLTDGRSLAVDTRYHAIGTPVFVEAPGLRTDEDGTGFRRLMVAQDVGSAIVGPERGDLFMGTGPEAGRMAGAVQHEGSFFVLQPQ